MDNETKARRAAWRAQARADLRRPSTWVIFAVLYAATYVLVAVVTSTLEVVVPHLPWIPKPYVNPDPPPLVLAFRCANLIAVMLPLLWITLYFGYDPNKVRKRRKT
jgi:hypothetical protein